MSSEEETNIDITEAIKLITKETNLQKKDLSSYSDLQISAMADAVKKVKKPPEYRTEAHLASFIDGYTFDWAFCLKVEFKAALDISRQEYKRVKNKKDENNNLIKDENNNFIAEKVALRTIENQGSNYSFKEGDTIYCSKLAYTDYNKFKMKPSLMIKVLKDSKEANYSKRDKGKVKFDLFFYKEGMPTHQRTIELAQYEFINFLKSGIIFDNALFSYVNVFERYSSYNDIGFDYTSESYG